MKNRLLLYSLSLFITVPSAMAQRVISCVEAVNVNATVGTVPQLPYQLWVTYSDGHSEYRQVRWSNAAVATEKAEVDSVAYPVGREYNIKGFITGDNATDNGFPVFAQVKVTASGSHSAPKMVAEPLPLGAVRLMGDNRLTWNRDLDIDHLLTLDVSQQLYNYRDTYGLPTDGYTMADGWDSPTTKLKGHGSGHYMSSLAFAYTSCTDKRKKAALKARIKRMVDELRECQERTFVYDNALGRYREARDYAPEAELKEMQGTWQAFDGYKQDYAHYGYGYINAIPAAHCVLIEKYSPYNNDSGVWAPYYTVHKQLAGLIDIANCMDDQRIAHKAYLIARDMGLWVWNRLHYRTFVKKDGTQAERRQRYGNRYEMWNMYIAGEVGGMAESLSRLAEMTTDTTMKEHLAEAAGYFDSPAFFDPLSRNIDDIRTRHANQHIPMIVGALRQYRNNGDTYYYYVAQNFWSLVQGRYRYAMGGVGNGEMFRQPYTQTLSMCTNYSSWGGGKIAAEPTLNETCCAYNLAKLTKDLNCFAPDDARYMDYYERVMYNQIVGSLNPRQYSTTYQYAVGLNASKPWGNDTPQSTCCGGTGTENHLKYQEAAYFVNDSAVWVALYLPSVAKWEAKGVTLQQDCQWPAEKSTINVTKGGGTFAMKLRVPYWATDGFEVRLNGKPIVKDAKVCTYVEIPRRKWRKGDSVEVIMPFTKHIDFAPDKMQLAVETGKEGRQQYTPLWCGTIMYGPLVMATTGITNWNDATMTMHTDLSDITLSGAKGGTGADANMYSLTFGGYTFVPDYATDRDATHYLRLDMGKAPLSAYSDDVQQIIKSNAIDLTSLRELMQDAQSRLSAQEQWEAMNVKVPEFSPWARHGIARLKEQYDACKGISDGHKPDVAQADIDRMAASLNAVLNTMRPGNLAEPEDLEELLALLNKAKAYAQSTKKTSARMKKAISYAEMVVSYVNDGSGTKDMIDRAVKEMKAIEVR